MNEKLFLNGKVVLTPACGTCSSKMMNKKLYLFHNISVIQAVLWYFMVVKFGCTLEEGGDWTAEILGDPNRCGNLCRYVDLCSTDDGFDIDDHFVKGVCDFMLQEIKSRKNSQNEIDPIIAKYVQHFHQHEMDKSLKRQKRYVPSGKKVVYFTV